MALNKTYLADSSTDLDNAPITATVFVPVGNDIVPYRYVAGAWAAVSDSAIPKSSTIGSRGVADGDKSDITVSASGATWTIDNGVVSTAKMGGDVTTAGKALLDDADAAAQRTTLGLGTLATQSGTFSGTSSGTNTGDQTLYNQTIEDEAVAVTQRSVVNFTGAGVSVADTGGKTTVTIAGGGGISDGDKGDITVSGSGAVWTVDNDVVTYAKMQNVSATDKLLGRSTAGAGDVEEIACTAAGRALIDDADASAQRTTLGLGTLATQSSVTEAMQTLADNTTGNVSTSAHGYAPKVTDTTKYLRGDGIWAAPTAAAADQNPNLLIQAANYNLTANYGMVVPEFYEIGDGFVLDLASGSILDII